MNASQIEEAREFASQIPIDAIIDKPEPDIFSLSNEEWDEQLVKEIDKFNNSKPTKKVGPVLKTCFDQNGEWYEILTKNNTDIPEDKLKDLKYHKLSEDEITKNIDGKIHLLTSYDNYTKDPIKLDYAVINGSCWAYNTPNFQAPNLTHTGGYLTLPSAKVVNLQNLTQIRGDLSLLSVTEIMLLKLEKIGGDLRLNNPKIFLAPKLKEFKGEIINGSWKKDLSVLSKKVFSGYLYKEINEWIKGIEEKRLSGMAHFLPHLKELQKQKKPIKLTFPDDIE